jgi:hypothetical protein
VDEARSVSPFAAVALVALAPLQVLQGSPAVQLRNREWRPLIQKALRNHISRTSLWTSQVTVLSQPQERSETPDEAAVEESPCEIGMVKMLCLSSFKTTKR